MPTFLPVLIDPILPVFSILAFGFGMGRTGRTTTEAARTINRFAMTVLIPIVVFDLLANAPFRQLELQPALLYIAVQAIVFTGGYQLARRAFGFVPGEAVVLGYGAVFANNVFYGLPLAQLIYGTAPLPIVTIVVLDATISFGGTMVALQTLAMGRVSPKGIALIFLKTPTLIAIFAGLAMGALALPIPAPLQTFLDFNGAAAAPVALFALGVILAETSFTRDPAVLTFTLVKLALFPASIWVVMRTLAPDAQADLWTFGAAPPTGAMAMSLALLYDIRTTTIAQILVWTSVLSLFTLAILA
ncbi:AEC family transporter [Ovoidimarina sediminis]|uniref:AEC family transporter n=1 Tax=Ovoidimarina sediminis TaxID=3079856 RepID=UPI00290FEC18|nr:AEC family transporter [Rhodophyticola sp. MJ-SS7]MDU8942138.1 AEC family transporter [Rhodophyticola sp. MJ-SS7]